MNLRLAKRTRRRGALDKAISFAAARTARLLAAPPLGPRYHPRGWCEALAVLRSLVTAGAANSSQPELEVVAQCLPWPGAGPEAKAHGSNTSAMVVMCEGCFFGGSYELCEAVRAELEPLGAARPVIIASDVIVSEAQIRRAQRAGADAIAPVALALTRVGYPLHELTHTARDLGLLVVPECARASDLDEARAAGLEAVIVGLRDRDTLRPCPEAAASLLEQAGNLLMFRLFASESPARTSS